MAEGRGANGGVAPLTLSFSQWSHHQKAHGELTLKSFAEHKRKERPARCVLEALLIRHGVLTLHITQRDTRDSPCAGRRQRNTAAGTTVKLPFWENGVDLLLRQQPGRDDESTLPHLPFGCFWLRLKKEKRKSQIE